MKKINWKVLIITSILCLLPILVGVYYYDALPNEVPIHFNINNEPDNYGSKEFAIFGLPIIMVVVQIFCCVVCDIGNKEQKKYKLIAVSKWIIPIITIVIYITTIGFALGYNIDIRRVSCLCVGLVFILIGNYFPKTDQKVAFRTGIHLHDIYLAKLDEKNYRKIARLTGYTFMISGILMIISLFFKPIFTVIVLVLVILVSIIITIYAFVLAKKNNKEE
ncbi:MAG: DUF1648 domain-containing protein [Clostridiales bacterium]|nr:DUF1648 domain-containing protein [Clostridiales bacterium]